MGKYVIEPWPPVGAVREWLRGAGLPVQVHPTLDVPPKAREMACALIEEEAGEFRAAVESSDLVEIADAVADLIWVTLEAAATFGIPIEPIFAEVTRSNLTKIETDQVVVNAAGKIVKGPTFSPPDLLPILVAHGYSSERRPEAHGDDSNCLCNDADTSRRPTSIS
jgi:NTP pyrophosphatase (non-canonical NTP hydrolase)